MHSTECHSSFSSVMQLHLKFVKKLEFLYLFWHSDWCMFCNDFISPVLNYSFSFLLPLSFISRGEALLRRRGQSSSTTFRRDGNIFRLGSQGGNNEDDDNNTWNGNSTQQM